MSVVYPVCTAFYERIFIPQMILWLIRHCLLEDDAGKAGVVLDYSRDSGSENRIRKMATDEILIDGLQPVGEVLAAIAYSIYWLRCSL